MQIRQLEYFVSLCDTLNFTRTAEAFYVSQTAVTQQIKVLEEELNTKLFERTRRSVSVTPAGRMLYDDARLIIRHMREAETRVRSLADNVRGTLRIGSLRGFEEEWYVTALHDFHTRMPGVQLSFVRGSSSELYRALRSGMVDVIFVLRFWENRKDLDFWPLDGYPLLVVCREDHPLADLPAIHPKDLEGYPMVMIHTAADDSGEDVVIKRFFREAGFTPEIVFRSEDIGTNMLAVSAGLGYALIPSYLGGHIQTSMHLVTRPMIGHETALQAAAVWNRDNENPLIAKLLEFCAARRNR